MLHVVMYHYVRDLPRTAFPAIKGMLTDEFRAQVDGLKRRHEMASLESALDFLRGEYQPKRDLCLLTFDDGLRDHYASVSPILAERGIQGIFFVITACAEDHEVASVHMNHFLTASLGFDRYKRAFLERLEPSAPSLDGIDEQTVKQIYRWDSAEVAAFKYLFNFVLDTRTRDRVVKELFAEHLGDEAEFSRALYFNWDEARRMQQAGMILGGHSHRHVSLSGLSDEDQSENLIRCRQLLTINSLPQRSWPFSYPYGRHSSFKQTTVRQLQQLGFDCAFSTEIGSNAPGIDRFTIRRIDCKDVTS
ncbi:MAG: polysaccharide deacetylase family protein [Gammaproteobacteria bacterium]